MLTHHRAEVIEVNVDQTRRMNDFRNAVAGLVEHIVRGVEAFFHRGRLRRIRPQDGHSE